jgi:hypothetical protein
MLLAWMSYRQYFPALSIADSGRPYSIAEFATEKDERVAAAYTSATTYPSTSPDLELGARRPRRKDLPGTGKYRDSHETETDDEAGMREPVGGNGGIPEGSLTGAEARFGENSEYRR